MTYYGYTNAGMRDYIIPTEADQFYWFMIRNDIPKAAYFWSRDWEESCVCITA